MWDIYINAVKSTFASRGRTFLSLFSIAVGVCAVILTINISSIGRNMISGEINSLGIRGLAVSAENTGAELTVRELNRIKTYPYVDSAVPLMIDTSNAYMRNVKYEVCLWGMDSEADKIISLGIKDGRFFSQGDISSCAKVCIIDEKFAASHYVDKGKSITIKNGNVTDKYRVIGIVKTGSGLLQNVMGGIIPDFIYLPYSTMQKNMGSENFTKILVSTDDNYDISLCEKKLINSMEKNSGKKQGYIINNLSAQKESLDYILSLVTIILAAVGSVSLLVAGINTMNIMLVSVKEKTKEIGIKKSLGASRGVIVSEFLIVSAVISLIGSIAGVALGEAFTFAGTMIFGLTAEYNIAIMLLIVGFTVFSGTVFGIYPAVKASRLEPAEAFRYY